MTESRVNITQTAGLERLLLHLRTAFDLDERSCFVCVNPLAVEIPPTTPNNRFVTVAPGAGQFPFDETCEPQMHEDTTAEITLYVRQRLDSSGREKSLILSETSAGLLQFKKDALAALTSVDLTTEEGDTFLRETIRPINATKPDYDPQKGVGWLTITIPWAFDWDLTP